jgi:ligand-binding sensor domain-containing protein
MEDKEGNIWIATFRGLDRFRHSTFAPISTGRTAKEFTLQAAEDGDVWIGSCWSGERKSCSRDRTQGW